MGDAARSSTPSARTPLGRPRHTRRSWAQDWPGQGRWMCASLAAPGLVAPVVRVRASPQQRVAHS
eukprot:8999549-Pyramimonas_sp.AAC.1